MLQGNEVGPETALQSIAMCADHHLLFGRKRVEGDFDFGDERQGALGAGQQLAQGEARVLLDNLYGLVDGITAAAALQSFVGVVFFDLGAG